MGSGARCGISFQPIAVARREPGKSARRSDDCGEECGDFFRGVGLCFNSILAYS